MHVISSTLLERHDYKIPDFIATSVKEIDFKVLWQHGLTTVLIDIDNTLVSFGAHEIHSHAAPYLEEARKRGYIKTLAIASNSRRDIGHIIEALKPDAVFQPHGLSYKPFRSYFQYALSVLNAQPEQTLMIGDRLIQDVWGARRSGIKAVLVKPLGRDLWLDKIILTRWRERRLLRRYLPHHREHWF